MKSSEYKVLWTAYARITLARMKKFKIDPMYVFRRSKIILAHHPH